MNAPEIPRLASGGVALCHVHQHAVMNTDGGINGLLVRLLKKEADAAISRRGNKCPHCGSVRMWAITDRTYKWACASCKRRFGRLRMHSGRLRHRHAEIMAAIDAGRTDREIADALGINRGTVKKKRWMAAFDKRWRGIE